MALAEDILTPQQRHVEQLRLQPAPVPVQQPQVVDRVAYIQQQTQARRQAEMEAQQSADLLRRMQAIQSPEFQQGINQMFQQGGGGGFQLPGPVDATSYAPEGIVQGGVGTQSALAIARQHARQSGVLTSDDPRAKYLRQLLDTDPTQYLVAVGEPGLIPGQVPGVGVTGALKNIYKAGELPFMEPVRQRVGQAAGVAAEAAMQATPGLAIAQWIGEELPGVPTPKGLAVGAAESAVPTNVWQVALELVPGIGTVPGASSALSRALKEGGYDLSAAGVRKFLAAEGTQGAMKKILAATQDELGALGGKRLVFERETVDPIAGIRTKFELRRDPNGHVFQRRTRTDHLGKTYTQGWQRIQGALYPDADRFVEGATAAGFTQQVGVVRKAIQDESGALRMARQAEDIGGAAGGRSFGDIAKEVRRLRDEAGEVQALRQELREAAGKPRVTARIQKLIAEAEAKGQRADLLNAQLDEMSGGRKWRVTSQGFGVAAPVDTTVITAPTEELARMRATLAGIPAARIKAVEEIPVAGIARQAEDLGGPTGRDIEASILEQVQRQRPLREMQQAIRGEELGQKAEAIGRAFEEAKTPDELIKGINQARKGALYQADFEPFKFGDDQMRWIIEKIRTTTKLKGRFQQANLVDAFQRIQNGYGIRDFEDKLITQVFGPEFAAVIRERGTNTILANIIRTWTPTGIDPWSLQEIVPVGQRYSTEAVQQGADIEVLKELAKAQKQGRGAFGIQIREGTLEADILKAMTPPKSAGPVEQPRVVRPFSNTTPNAADEAVTAAVNKAVLERQLAKGAQPEWYYREQSQKAAQRALDALSDPDPLRKWSEIWRDRALTPFQLWRSWVTSFDNSFLGRQGWKLAASNTREWLGALKRSYQAMWSPELAARVDAEVRAFPTYELGQRMKRPLAIIGEERKAEEYLASTKGVPLLNRFERAYTAAANYVRQSTLERDVNTWVRHNNDAPIPDDVAQRLIDNINNATLYGNLSALQNDRTLLGQTFFSLRAKAALPQFLMDTARVMRPGVDPTTRRIVATRFAGWLTLNMGLLYAIKWGGAKSGAMDADLNPFSPTFGKIKLGPQTFDLWAGYAPLVRAVVGTGAALDGIDERNPSEIWGRYVRNQLSPAASVVYDFGIAGGKDYRGKNLYDREEILKYGLGQTTPLFFTDVWEAWKANGIVGLMTAPPAAFSGIGAGAYTESEAVERKKNIQQFEQEALAPLELSIDRGKVSFDFEPSDDRRKKMAAEMFDGDTLEGLSVKEIQDKWIAERAELFVAGGMPEQAAKAEATRLLGLFETVKEADRDRDAFARRTWEEHPEILKRALELGLTDPAAYKNEILEKAGLR